LGSFFSASLGHQRELEIVQHAKNILEDPTISRRVSVDQVAAWILRTLYLRLTTRPHVAWLASNIAMHLAEATGIHHEMDAMVLTTDFSSPRQALNQTGCQHARRLFWSAWMINSMISYEYGRSSSSLNNITCKQPLVNKGDYTALLISLAQLVPRESLDAGPDLQHTLPKIQQIPDEHPFLSMSKADLCMSLYRHHRLLKQPVERRAILQIISIGNTATEAAYKLAQEGKFWWNVLCTVFQYICVLLAIDTSDSLAQVSSNMCTLENIAGLLGTHVSNEAVNTLKILLRDSMKKKRQEVQLLEAADSDLNANAGNDLGSVENVDINWDALLDPWYVPTFLPQEFPMGIGAGGGVPAI
jgi:Fungal specific transcription factor domain